jgi:hypothetical protein
MFRPDTSDTLLDDQDSRVSYSRFSGEQPPYPFQKVPFVPVGMMSYGKNDRKNVWPLPGQSSTESSGASYACISGSFLLGFRSVDGLIHRDKGPDNLQGS